MKGLLVLRGIKRSLLFVGAIGSLAALCPAAPKPPGAVPSYRITDLGTRFSLDTGDDYYQPEHVPYRGGIDINDRGQVIGFVLTKKKNEHGFRLFDGVLWQNGKVRRRLRALPGDFPSTLPRGINGRGQVVGDVSDTTTGAITKTTRRPFVWTNGRMRHLSRFG